MAVFLGFCRSGGRGVGSAAQLVGWVAAFRTAVRNDVCFLWLPVVTLMADAFCGGGGDV